MACLRRIAALLLLIGLPGWGAITRTARGTIQIKGGASLETDCSGDFDPADTDRIIAIFASDGTSISTANWIGLGDATLVENASVDNTGNVRTHIVSVSGAGLGSGHVRITQSGTGNARACLTLTLSGGNGLPVFAAASTGTGTGTAASTGSFTCTPNSGADCAWNGGVGAEDNLLGQDAPSWTNPNNAGQQDGTEGGGSTSNITALEGYEIDSGAVTQALAATLESSADWAAVMVTYKEPASGGAVVKDIIMRGVIVRPR